MHLDVFYLTDYYLFTFFVQIFLDILRESNEIVGIESSQDLSRDLTAEEERLLEAGRTDRNNVADISLTVYTTPGFR
jgi:hypothetical protein